MRTFKTFLTSPTAPLDRKALWLKPVEGGYAAYVPFAEGFKPLVVVDTKNTGTVLDDDTMNVNALNTKLTNMQALIDALPTYYTVTTTTTGEGTVNGAGKYPEGSVILLEAVPAEGHSFIQWSDDDITNPRMVTVNADLTIGAEFSE